MNRFRSLAEPLLRQPPAPLPGLAALERRARQRRHRTRVGITGAMVVAAVLLLVAVQPWRTTPSATDLASVGGDTTSTAPTAPSTTAPGGPDLTVDAAPPGIDLPPLDAIDQVDPAVLLQVQPRSIPIGDAARLTIVTRSSFRTCWAFSLSRWTGSTWEDSGTLALRRDGSQFTRSMDAPDPACVREAITSGDGEASSTSVPFDTALARWAPGRFPGDSPLVPGWYRIRDGAALGWFEVRANHDPATPPRPATDASIVLSGGTEPITEARPATITVHNAGDARQRAGCGPFALSRWNGWWWELPVPVRIDLDTGDLRQVGMDDDCPLDVLDGGETVTVPLRIPTAPDGFALTSGWYQFSAWGAATVVRFEPEGVTVDHLDLSTEVPSARGAADVIRPLAARRIDPRTIVVDYQVCDELVRSADIYQRADGVEIRLNGMWVVPATCAATTPPAAIPVRTVTVTLPVAAAGRPVVVRAIAPLEITETRVTP